MNQIAHEIKTWRKICRAFESSPLLTTILCSGWNWATVPYRAMTDKEHSACRRLARRIDKRLQDRSELWKELSNGMRWPK